eukprot:562156-Rhodomonas_salina.2
MGHVSTRHRIKDSQHKRCQYQTSRIGGSGYLLGRLERYGAQRASGSSIACLSTGNRMANS